LWGGVVPRLCVFIPDPARPGDPPGRLRLKFLQISTDAAAETGQRAPHNTS
jgi:hypothetical protein